VAIRLEKRLFKNVIEWVIIIAVAITMALLLRYFVVDVRVVPTGSMIPTIELNDRVVVDRLFYKMGELKRGDIIVFTAPNKQELKDLQNQDLVKRLIALPGETIEIKDGYVWIDGRALNEPYVNDPSGHGLTQWSYGPEQVPQGHYFVMGDNRGGSNDSRSWGFLDQKLVCGRVWIRYLPLDRIGPLMKPPDDYFLDLTLTGAEF
jgi:signal peptidase I